MRDVPWICADPKCEDFGIEHGHAGPPAPASSQTNVARSVPVCGGSVFQRRKKAAAKPNIGPVYFFDGREQVTAQELAERLRRYYAELP